MARRTKCPPITRQVHLRLERRQCSAWGGSVWAAYETYRTVTIRHSRSGRHMSTASRAAIGWGSSPATMIRRSRARTTSWSSTSGRRGTMSGGRPGGSGHLGRVPCAGRCGWWLQWQHRRERCRRPSSGRQAWRRGRRSGRGWTRATNSAALLGAFARLPPPTSPRWKPPSLAT